MPLKGTCLFNTNWLDLSFYWCFRNYEDFSDTLPFYLSFLSQRQFLVLTGTSVSKKGKFVSSGFGSSRPEAKGVWLPSMMPSCAGLAAKELTPYPTVAKNAFQEQSKQVSFTSHPERFLGSWPEGLDEPLTLPQMTGRRNSKSTFSS